MSRTIETIDPKPALDGHASALHRTVVRRPLTMCSPATPTTRSRCERLAARVERDSVVLALSTTLLVAVVHPGAALALCVVLASVGARRR
ncbi:hypothetical protein [Haloplanus sp. C73]|uniref:hypothetical protein n=1 Tax=Haloplanus sp. C73 TaxID=3421641 RepID=UPI003EB6A597